MTTAVGSYVTAARLKSRAGISDSSDDTEIGYVCDGVNQDIETITKQPICPISSATYTYDGEGLTRIFLPTPINAATKGIGGLRAITLLEFGSASSGVYTYSTIASTDYELRDRHGVKGPYRWLLMSRYPAGSYTAFPSTQRIRITGTAGWDAIPDDLTEAAISIARRRWNARQAGEQTIDGVDETGRRIVYASPVDMAIIKSYRLRPPV